ncbi:DNA-(apurinic or apyrimidinic site) lyase, partial [Geospiza fortis]|uniref:DNA repair nuclease/redox regulator APEX1 n=1 Tax=Geospiza fortis TaxID=48883 RepID=A0A8N5I596_GEOFO
GAKWVQEEAPDVLCLQETKCAASAVPAELRELPGLPHQFWSSAKDRPGYSGAAFLRFLQRLDARKPVLLCGDLNVAHAEIDLCHPRANRASAGFTPQEREGFSKLLDSGFVDSFRHLYPEARGAFTFWTYLGGARARNVGWRLDYAVVSRRLLGALCDCKIRSAVQGSDHCPITALLAV